MRSAREFPTAGFWGDWWRNEGWGRRAVGKSGNHAAVYGIGTAKTPGDLAPLSQLSAHCAARGVVLYAKPFGLRLSLSLLIVLAPGCQDEPADLTNTSRPLDQGQVGDLSRDCDRVVFLGGDCRPADETGSTLDPLAADVAMRVCFVNTSGRTLTLGFPSELFNRGSVVLASGDHATLTVQEIARGKTYSYSVDGCKQRAVLTTPEIKVGPPPPPGP